MYVNQVGLAFNEPADFETQERINSGGACDGNPSG
jgi:hypothetical protein